MLNEAFFLDQDTPIREDFSEIWIFDNVEKYDSSKVKPFHFLGNLTVLTIINIVVFML